MIGHDNSPFPSAMARRQDARRLVVRDANGQALVYLYSRDNKAEALQAKLLTAEEARRIAINVGKG
jgi:K+/H+ antiporter YhaU regulatory subunit KhtT